MKHWKTLLVMLMVLSLCAALAACGSAAEPTQAESVTEGSRAEKESEVESQRQTEPAQTVEPEDTATQQPTDAVKPVNVGVIAWSTGMGEEAEFVNALQTALSRQEPDQIGDVLVMDAAMDADTLHMILANTIVNWEGETAAIVFVNDANGFSDEELLSAIKTAENAGFLTGVDHAIDGAPESTFVYDASDAAGCASMLLEKALP